MELLQEQMKDAPKGPRDNLAFKKLAKDSCQGVQGSERGEDSKQDETSAK
ncbi:MAG: hypothetical protein IJS50_01775 [Desulfovibrio sp.]|nr:hypothetical protein [Desulfovibrio sp.]